MSGGRGRYLRIKFPDLAHRHLCSLRHRRPSQYHPTAHEHKSVFLQAEDGIRYFHVTGVQTCALPILGVSVAVVIESSFSFLKIVSPQSHRELRSEERRVGKECRSRWSPYH